MKNKPVALLHEIARRLDHIQLEDMSEAENQICQLLVDNSFGRIDREHEPEFRSLN